MDDLLGPLCALSAVGLVLLGGVAAIRSVLHQASLVRERPGQVAAAAPKLGLAPADLEAHRGRLVEGTLWGLGHEPLAMLLGRQGELEAALVDCAVRTGRRAATRFRFQPAAVLVSATPRWPSLVVTPEWEADDPAPELARPPHTAVPTGDDDLDTAVTLHAATPEDARPLLTPAGLKLLRAHAERGLTIDATPTRLVVFEGEADVPVDGLGSVLELARAVDGVLARR